MWFLHSEELGHTHNFPFFSSGDVFHHEAITLSSLVRFQLGFVRVLFFCTHRDPINAFFRDAPDPIRTKVNDFKFVIWALFKIYLK